MKRLYSVVLSIFVMFPVTSLAGSWVGNPITLEADAIHSCIDTSVNPVTGVRTDVAWRHTGTVTRVVMSYPGIPDMPLLDFVTQADTGVTVQGGIACVETTTQPFPWLYLTRDPRTCAVGWAYCVEP